MMTRVIRTEEDYSTALEEIEHLMELDPDPDTAESDKLQLLAILVERYEAEHYSLGLPDPVEAILFRMEQLGLQQRDLVPYLGSKSRVSEILSRKRPLSLNMIRALSSGLGIPAEVLIQEVKEGMGS